jgi:hypothetical protein
MTTLSERNEIARCYERLAKAHEESGAYALMHAYRQAAQSLRQSPLPTAEGKVELWRAINTPIRFVGDIPEGGLHFERDTAAENAVTALRMLSDALNGQEMSEEVFDAWTIAGHALVALDRSRGVNNG